MLFNLFMATWKEKYNKKYNNSKDISNSLSDISKATGVSIKGLQQIYNKGVGAFKTNPTSVRPNVTSKEQWAMARVYSAVMGGKASEVDAKELKMEKGGLIAPNGKQSNLTSEQYKLVRTPEFKAWFGDWENDPKNASKVVDENGEPLVVYHGSNNDFNAFEEQKIGLTDDGWYGYGYYFSASTEMSDLYGKSKPYFLNIKKIFNTNKDNPFYSGGKEVTEYYVDKGYDGSSKTFDVNNLFHEYCVFFPFPNQIKLADGSNTTFDSSNDDIRFEKGGLIAPNGKPSNLTLEQHKLVRTPKFKAWFGDWENSPEMASKVVDENGEPMVVYHGTKKKFNVFKYTQKRDIGFLGAGFYFTNNKKMAQMYAQYNYVYEVFLNIKNPLIVKEFKSEQTKKDSDGIIYCSEELLTFDKEEFYCEYVAFNPPQIKLADGSNTTFDSSNKDIRFEKGGETKAVFYENYYKNLSPSKFKVMKKGDVIEIDMMPNGAVDLIDETEAIIGGFFKKGGETNFNPDGAIKDKIVHASGEAGGMLVGKRHSKGGIKAINKSTGQPLEMEGGEVVITRNAVSDPQKRMFNGQYMTNREILSTINESGGGVSFADGGQVPDEITIPNVEFNFGGQNMKAESIAQRLMKTGGVTCENTYEKGGVITLDDFPDKIEDATYLKVLGGSTSAELYEYKGKLFVYKKGASKEHFQEEYYANQIYEFYKIPVPKTKLLDNGLLKEYIDDVRNVDWDNEDDARQILNGYAVDSLLANWDIYKNDNILVSNKTGIPYRIDNGGALRYRAQGGLKNDFDEVALEIEILRAKNPEIEKYYNPRITYFECKRCFTTRRTLARFLRYYGFFTLQQILGDRTLYLNDFANDVESTLDIKVGDIVSNTDNLLVVNEIYGSVINVKSTDGLDYNYAREDVKLNTPKEKTVKENENVFLIDYPLEKNDLYKVVDFTLLGRNIEIVVKNTSQLKYLKIIEFLVKKSDYGVENPTKTTTNQKNKKPSLDDIKEKVIFNTDKGFKGKSLFTDTRIGKDIFDEYSKLSNEFETLEELLPLFQYSKDSQNRAIILSEMSRLRRKIDYDLDVELNEMQAFPKDLFTTEGLLNYYYKQTSQSPVNSDLKPCNLPTPNAKKSKLPISAYLNVRTRQFKNWFGDWEEAVKTKNFVNCSTMIDDETLEPKIYYHGVRRFQGNRGASAMGAGINRPFGDFNPTNFSASFFADNKEYADFYGGTSENLPPSERREGFIYAVFLNIRRPIDLRPLGFKSSYRDLLDYIAVKYGVISEPSQAIFDINLIQTENEEKPIWTFVRNDELLLQTLQDYGYDALFQIGDIPVFDENGNILNDRDKWNKDNEYLTFKPNQVKSVNVKKSLYLSIFDDIRFKKGGYVSI